MPELPYVLSERESIPYATNSSETALSKLIMEAYDCPDYQKDAGTQPSGNHTTDCNTNIQNSIDTNGQIAGGGTDSQIDTQGKVETTAKAERKAWGGKQLCEKNEDLVFDDPFGNLNGAGDNLRQQPIGQPRNAGDVPGQASKLSKPRTEAVKVQIEAPMSEKKLKLDKTKFSETNAKEGMDVALLHNLPVILYTGAGWCPKCPAQSANVDAIASQKAAAHQTDAIVIKLDADAAQRLASSDTAEGKLLAKLMSNVIKEKGKIPRIDIYDPKDVSKPTSSHVIANQSLDQVKKLIDGGISRFDKGKVENGQTTGSRPQQETGNGFNDGRMKQTGREKDATNETKENAKLESDFKVKTTEEAKKVIELAKRKNLPLVVHSPTAVCTKDSCTMTKLDPSIPGKFADKAIFLQIPRGGFRTEDSAGSKEIQVINEQFKVTNDDHKTELDIHVFGFDSKRNNEMEERRTDLRQSKGMREYIADLVK